MRKAYSGESIPENVLETIEASQSSNQKKWVKLFFMKKITKVMYNFQKYLRNNFPGITFEKKLKPWEDWNSEWRSHLIPLQFQII